MVADRVQKRLVFALVVASMAVSAYFQAKGAVHLLARALLPDAASVSGQERESDAASRLARNEREPKTAHALLSRNPFDSVTGSLIDTKNTEPPRGDLSDPFAAPECEGVGVAIVSESADASWSLATLRGADLPGGKRLRAGDDVPAGKVAFIGHNPRRDSPAVWIETRSSLCQALLFTPARVLDVTAPQQPQPPSGASAVSPLLAAIASRIKKVSETELEVDRSVIADVLKNQLALTQSVRIVPEQKDGKVLGVRLFGVRPDTLLAVLGLQNGDRLESANGFEMASPQAMLELYARLPTASSLSLKVNRRGQAMSIDYRFR
jgi:general secretion pathway protein C